ncbi:protein EXECUTER 1, chloroplastic-like [Rutidosis leptorrhynchoides]|uniref:protein EXECUTER 1, chloroplastic-like n=1 Tax=Rutidosis leptorrhynchoides TaxID=125765 RepID=UPI003A98D4B2
MASISPSSFSSTTHHHKLIHFKSINSSTQFSRPHLSRVLNSPLTCRCQKSNNNNNDDDESPSLWESVVQENVRNVIKWFDDFITGFGDNQIENIVLNSNIDDDDDDDYSDEDWDWDRWKKHFDEVDEQERIVTILKSQLNRAVMNEDYEDAARIKVAIAAASNNDTVGRVMYQLNKAIKEERYKDAAFVRDYASAGLVGWWAGFSDDRKDPYGRIIRISAEHGRYLARSYSPRQLAKDADGAPLFELFITMNEKGEYRHQAVYLKQKENPGGLSIPSSTSSGLIDKVGPLDFKNDKNNPFAKDKEDTDYGDDASEEYGFDMISGAKDVKIKVMNMSSSGKIDRDVLSNVVEQIMEEDDDGEGEGDDDGDDDIDEVKDESDEDQYDIDIDIDIDAGNTIVDGEDNSQIAVMMVVDGLGQKGSNETSQKDLVRVPAQLDKRNRSSFTFSIEKEKNILSSNNAQSVKDKDAKVIGNRSADSVMLDLAKSIGRGKIPMKVLKDVSQLINHSLKQAQNRQPLSGSTTFNRIELPSTRDPLNGLYVGAHGISTSEVIQLKRKFGQWQDEGNTKFSNLEFYEYVEAVKITGDPYVPAGQVAFRAKVGTKYQLPHQGIIPEEFGVIARYRGQGRLADRGFQNPRWVDGELVILDGKYINEGIVVGFVYWDPKSHFLVFFNQLSLQE